MSRRMLRRPQLVRMRRSVSLELFGVGKQTPGLPGRKRRWLMYSWLLLLLFFFSTLLLLWSAAEKEVQMTRISTILVRRRSAAVAKALMACLIYPRIIYIPVCSSHKRR